MRIRNLFHHIWDPNALGGQFATLALGMLVTVLEAVLAHRIPEGEPLVICVALLIIPPFFLPARGYDRHERWQKFAITFGTSYFFGVLLGTVPAHMFVKELEKEMVSISGLSAILDTIVVCLAYWSTGHLSRVFVQEYTYRFARLPLFCSRMIAALIAMGFQNEARDFTVALDSVDLHKAAKILVGSSREAYGAARDETHLQNLQCLFKLALDEIENWDSLSSGASH